jgi:hypothetical protein
MFSTVSYKPFISSFPGAPALSGGSALIGHAGYRVDYILQSIFIRERFQPDLHISRFFPFLHFLFLFFIDQRVVQTPLNAHGPIQGRIGFTHIAFERKSGIGFLENIPGGTGGSAKIAFFVFSSVNDVSVPTHAFSHGMFARVDRKKHIAQGFSNQSDSGSGRIAAAVFRRRMKGGADDFACPAAIAFIHIDFNNFDLLISFGHF